jgi:hypothetical protein
VIDGVKRKKVVERRLFEKSLAYSKPSKGEFHQAQKIFANSCTDPMIIPEYLP